MTATATETTTTAGEVRSAAAPLIEARRLEQDGWFRIVSFGSYGEVNGPPARAYRGREAADAARRRWCDRLGSEAGSAMAAMSVRIVGPFRTRERARRASITDRPAA